MTKWICDCGCGCVIEAKDAPKCCGKPMKKLPAGKEVKGCCCCSC